MGNSEKLQEIKQSLIVRRGRRSTYYMSIKVDGETYGNGFDDAHFYDALKNLDDKSFYDDAEMSAVNRLMNHHMLDLDLVGEGIY